VSAWFLWHFLQFFHIWANSTLLCRRSLSGRTPVPVPLGLLQGVGQSALGIFTGGFSSVAEIGSSIASQVWEWWGKRKQEEERRAELEALAQATAEELRITIREIVAELAGGRPAAEQSRLEGYLLAVPAQIRRTLRRSSDVAGLTVPPDLVLSRMEDLIPMLPPRPPRFAAIDHVPGTDFELVELLGIGGFGEVWKARNAYMPGAPMVALKFCLNETAAASLRRETELLDRIQRTGSHPGIVQLRHTFLRAEPPFLEYELIEGGDLGGLIVEWHRKKGGPTPDEAARLIRRLAEIVAFAHGQGIIHRDLKPANILLSAERGTRNAELKTEDVGLHSSFRAQNSVLKIADFGIGAITAEAATRLARKTGTASTRTAAAACGGYSLYYASPEQVRGAPADPRDDVHAIGVIWYQLLVGDLTAEAPRGPGWKKRLAAKRMSAELIEFLEACTASDREDRPASAAEVAEQLGLMVAEGSSAAASSRLAPTSSLTRYDWDRFLARLVAIRGKAKDDPPVEIGAFFVGVFLGAIAACASIFWAELGSGIGIAIGVGVMALAGVLMVLAFANERRKTEAKLRADFPTEMAAFGDFDQRSVAVLDGIIKEVERRLASM
jgi:serine/threonine protein kinase